MRSYLDLELDLFQLIPQWRSLSRKTRHPVRRVSKTDSMSVMVSISLYIKLTEWTGNEIHLITRIVKWILSYDCIETDLINIESKRLKRDSKTAFFCVYVRIWADVKSFHEHLAQRKQYQRQRLFNNISKSKAWIKIYFSLTISKEEGSPSISLLYMTRCSTVILDG